MQISRIPPPPRDLRTLLVYLIAVGVYAAASAWIEHALESAK
jgi:hypothetical protein